MDGLSHWRDGPKRHFPGIAFPALKGILGPVAPLPSSSPSLCFLPALAASRQDSLTIYYHTNNKQLLHGRFTLVFGFLFHSNFQLPHRLKFLHISHTVTFQSAIGGSISRTLP
ncbi:hypothetical protein VTK26DRAFT_6937 [Humicola hyalothermophila]